MDPCAPSPAPGAQRLPRTRGDGPDSASPSHALIRASPHTRGWTRRRLYRRRPRWGFPAHAGMDPSESAAGGGSRRLPRTRGDGPRPRGQKPKPSPASPHTRGWTRVAAAEPAGRLGFPAHAGMDPSLRRPMCAETGLPRTRGDGPPGEDYYLDLIPASPHTRGWTRIVSPEPDHQTGFPAHAGMDPTSSSRATAGSRLPRTRGDGPRTAAGVSSSIGASPHTRGWTLTDEQGITITAGFPAHAGMDPPPIDGAKPRERLPRTRGDGPRRRWSSVQSTPASPHTRGWPLSASVWPSIEPGFPAHAGMDPVRRVDRAVRSPTRASPHTRGWTP